jgi:hypothetical protein
VKDISIVIEKGVRSATTASLGVIGGTGTSTNDTARGIEFLETVVSAMAAVTANATQISVLTASDTAMALAQTIVLAKALGATFDDNTAAQMMGIISATLSARGTSSPDRAVQAIPSVLDDLARLHIGDARAADELVALASFSSARPGAWRAAYNKHAGIPAGNETTTSLESPIKVRTSTSRNGGEAAAGGAEGAFAEGLASWAQQSATITVVQYSGSRNPYWPSTASSTDVLNLRISPPSVTRQRGRRLVAGNTTAATPSAADGVANWRSPPNTINVTFAVTSQLFSDGQSNMIHSPVTYQSQDGCGGNTTHSTGTAFLPSSGKRMWCAMWNPRAGASGEWTSDPCRILSINISIETGIDGTEEGRNSDILTKTTVWCECVFVLAPVGPASNTRPETGIDMTLSIVDFAFSRVAQSFSVTTPLRASMPAVLLSVVPILLYVVIMGYFIRRRRRYHIVKQRAQQPPQQPPLQTAQKQLQPQMSQTAAEDWHTHVDDNTGREYFEHRHSGKVVWDIAAAAATAATAAMISGGAAQEERAGAQEGDQRGKSVLQPQMSQTAAEDWHTHIDDDTGREYFEHRHSGKVVWDIAAAAAAAATAAMASGGGTQEERAGAQEGDQCGKSVLQPQMSQTADSSESLTGAEGRRLGGPGGPRTVPTLNPLLPPSNGICPGGPGGALVMRHTEGSFQGASLSSDERKGKDDANRSRVSRKSFVLHKAIQFAFHVRHIETDDHRSRKSLSSTSPQSSTRGTSRHAITHSFRNSMASFAEDNEGSASTIDIVSESGRRNNTDILRTAARVWLQGMKRHHDVR